MNYEFNSTFGPFNPPSPAIISHHNHYQITRSPPLGTFRKSHPPSPFCAPLVPPRDNSSLLPSSIPSPYFIRSAGSSRPVRPSVVPISPHISNGVRSTAYGVNPQSNLGRRNISQLNAGKRARPVPSLKPFRYSSRTYLYVLTCNIPRVRCCMDCMDCNCTILSVLQGSRHHAPSLCCDSTVATLSRPCTLGSDSKNMIPTPVSPVCQACLSVSVRCRSAAHQQLRKADVPGACGVIGRQRWIGTQWH